MKVTAVIAPVVVVGLIFVLVWGVSMLTLQAGAVATKQSVELVRLQMRVARLHDALLVHSQQSLERQLEQLNEMAARAAALSAQAPPPADPAADPDSVDDPFHRGLPPAAADAPASDLPTSNPAR